MKRIVKNFDAAFASRDDKSTKRQKRQNVVPNYNPVKALFSVIKVLRTVVLIHIKILIMLSGLIVLNNVPPSWVSW